MYKFLIKALIKWNRKYNKNDKKINIRCSLIIKLNL